MDKVNFTVNGEHYSLSGSEVGPDTTLIEYLRVHLQLSGTKAMCREGGCGACIVSVVSTNPQTHERHVFSVNSCLVLILSCHEWDITTIEGLGNRKDGYHPIQQRLAAFNGTQCGYCTPGWIMGMHSLYEGAGKKLTSTEVENSFGSNICRCTGYRPILDAFKSFATDADPSIKEKLQDMEDLDKLGCLKPYTTRSRLASASQDEWCVIEQKDENKAALINLPLEQGSRWYKAYTINDVFKILTNEGVQNCRLVAGNTGSGVFYPPTTKILLDISSVASLQEWIYDVNMCVGAGSSLADVITQMRRWAGSKDGFQYLNGFADHVQKVAHTPVRNIGTLGGNLAMKHAHPEFPSDIFVILDTVGATVTIMNSNLEKKDVATQAFLDEDLTGKLIVSVKLPPLTANYLVRTYKIMPRAQSAHAILNAGFCFHVNSENQITDTRIVFGNIGRSFTRAASVEKALENKQLFSDETLQTALTALAKELQPAVAPPEPSPECRKTLALGLLYKALLSLCPADKVNPRYLSGGTELGRGLSRGEQHFNTEQDLWPLTQPVPKLEALVQCSGEALYACDVPMGSRDVHVALVLADRALANIDGFDASEALQMPGVVGFFTAKDIPGKNCFTPLSVLWQTDEEEILASKRTLYNGQPVALVAAVTRSLALRAARAVRVNYSGPETLPVLDIRSALKAPDKNQRVREEVNIKRTDRGADVTQVIKGSYAVGGQYHFTMETQSCRARQSSRGMHLRAATQWIDHVHVAVAQSLGIQENQVFVEVGRVGGAYGGKASRASLGACAAALVAFKLNRAAELVMPLGTNMRAIGKRQECQFDYEIGVNATGLIQYANVTYYSDVGCCFNDTAASEVALTMANLYDTTRFDIKGYSVLTDTPSNTWCRAPSTTEATALMEHIMERIAHVTSRDPIEIRLQHVLPIHDDVRSLVTDLKKDCDYDNRATAIRDYNAKNAWKKRGLSLGIMSYPIGFAGNFPVTISVYHADGTVLAAHGGIEMGQGINTKLAQVVAHSLQIPLKYVAVHISDSFVSPNSSASAGSITSESVAYAAIRACADLKQQIEAAQEDTPTPLSWEEKIKNAYDKGVFLQASYMTGPMDNLTGYSVYGACAMEVELDVLTGERVIRRCDIREDTGRSLSPQVDVGQVEGALIMGLALWLGGEQIQYEPSTGRLLTNSTWSYSPPGATDIPVDLRVTLVNTRSMDKLAPILRSKATGEPALVLAVVFTHALRAAAQEARKEFGYTDTDWLQIDVPNSVENVLKAISHKTPSFKLT